MLRHFKYLILLGVIGMEQYAGLALQQTLSPQMQQSLHILQAPITELRQMVAEEIRANPVLEEEPPDVHSESAEKPETAPNGAEAEWTEYYAQRATAEPWTTEASQRRQHFFDSQTRPVGLQQHLLEQLAMTTWSRREKAVGVEIIGNVDEQGYLRANAEEIAESTGGEPEDVEKILAEVQQFDPPGVAARDLAECLLIQLRQKGRQYGMESRIVKHHLEELGRKKLGDIARQLNIPVTQVQRAAEIISQLEPRPGRNFSTEPDQAIIPDVVVEKDGGEYVVHLNQDDIPRLKIGDSYKDMISQGGCARDVREYLRDKIKGGKFLIKSIQQRQQTILNIARQIVDQQKEFFEHGPSHLKPMTMSQVADAVGVHETTVSRAASGKYMATPRGVFEIKYFFTHGYTTSEGQSVSNESVRQAIVSLVRDENARAPLSDQEIVVRLGEQGITVARRTVAKYREQLNILPSHLRKSF